MRNSGACQFTMVSRLSEHPESIVNCWWLCTVRKVIGDEREKMRFSPLRASPFQIPRPVQYREGGWRHALDARLDLQAEDTDQGEVR